MGAQADLQRRDGQHAAELAGAENADRRAGAQDHRASASSGRSATEAVRSARQASSRDGQRLVRERQHGAGEQRRIDRAGFADRQRPDRDARRHLHDRQQAVLARQRLRRDGNAEHRQGGEGRGHAGQVRRAARAGDDDLEPLGLRALGEGDEPVGRAMGGDDPGVVADPERFERLGGAAHHRPVRLAAHDDGDGFCRAVHGRPPTSDSPKTMEAAIRGRPRAAQAPVRTRPPSPAFGAHGAFSAGLAGGTHVFRDLRPRLASCRNGPDSGYKYVYNMYLNKTRKPKWRAQRNRLELGGATGSRLSIASPILPPPRQAGAFEGPRNAGTQRRSARSRC